MIGAAGQVHPAGGQLDEEEDVEAAEQDGINGEEVTSHDGAGVSTEEFAPRQASTTRGRRYALAPKHSADGGSREPVTQLAQLTLDPKVAPGGVLGGQPEDEISKVNRNGPPAQWTAPPEGCPFSPHQLAVPADGRLGSDQQ